MVPETKEIKEEDNKCDRVFDAKLVGKIICANYVSGVAKGTVQYYNWKLDKYLLLFEDGSTDLFEEKDVDGDEMWFVDKEKPRKRVEKLPKSPQTAKITSSDKDVENTNINSENDLFDPNSDANFSPVSESHEKPSESSIVNVQEICTNSPNSVTGKSQYSNCKVCKIRIPFKHINIHMKARHPSPYNVEKFKNKIEENKQFPNKSQSKEPSNSKQVDENSAIQNDLSELIEVSTKTVQESKSSEDKSEKYVDNNIKTKKAKKTPELIKCSLCPYSFHPGIILNQHMNLCKKYSSSIENCHEGFSCKLCLFKNPVRSEILKHIKKKHPKVADLDEHEETSNIGENVEKEDIEISEYQIPVRSEILEHFKMKHLKAANLDEPKENSNTVEHVENNPKEADLGEPKNNSNIVEHLKKIPVVRENLKHIKKKHLKAADLYEPKENSKIDKNVEKEIVEISCPYCEDKIPKYHSNEQIKKCKQALKYIHDLLCLQCNIKFKKKFEIFRHVVLHHLDEDDVDSIEIEETLGNLVKKELTSGQNQLSSGIEVITISDSDSDMNDDETNDTSESINNFQIKSENTDIFQPNNHSDVDIASKVNFQRSGKRFCGGFDNSALPVFHDSESLKQFAKEIPMIETDDSEDEESLIEFVDLSESKKLSKLYKGLIVKVNEENLQRKKKYDQLKRKRLIESQKKPFLNKEVKTDEKRNRQSSDKENLIDDQPQVIGYNCNPNAKETFDSPTIKQEIKKAYNPKSPSMANNEKEKSHEKDLLKKCSLCQGYFSVRTRIDERHEDLNRHLENCEEFQKISKKPKKYCPICQREPKNSLIFHIKRHILGGNDSSDSPSESSDHSDSDDIIIISDSDDNDSIDSGVHNDTNDFANNLNLVPSSTPRKHLQTNQKLRTEAKIDKPILETQNLETEDIIQIESFPREELKEPKPLILSYYECPLPNNTCPKWRSLEDVNAHVKTYHRMSMDVLDGMPGIKLAPKILK